MAVRTDHVDAIKPIKAAAPIQAPRLRMQLEVQNILYIQNDLPFAI